MELWKSQADDSLWIDPLLESDQIGETSIDLRLGYDFLVSIQTRSSSIDVSRKEDPQKRAIASYFQETRRELGEKFILHPSQVVLACSLEYLSIPSNIIADLYSRSSYNRLGLPINSSIQPGFRGCAPIELFNHGNTPVELVVGARICQIRLYELPEKSSYISNTQLRKYYGDVRPRVSAADNDSDIKKLLEISNKAMQ